MLQLKFKEPWEISSSQEKDYAQITYNNTESIKALPRQMWHSEVVILQILLVIMAIMIFLLTVEQISNRNRHINIIVKKILPLVLICHVLSIDVATPASLEQFNK